MTTAQIVTLAAQGVTLVSLVLLFVYARRAFQSIGEAYELQSRRIAELERKTHVPRFRYHPRAPDEPES